MKKTFIYTASALLLFAASCKENVLPMDFSEATLAEDSTYVAKVVEPAEPRRLLIEELSGVTCVNCPQGSEMLETLNTQNPGQLSIITFHTGTWSDPMIGKSIQDFRTDEGKELRDQVWGGEGNKPTAIFNRLLLGSGLNKYFIDGYPSWPAAVIQDRAAHLTTPLNLSVKSTYNEKKDQYDIEVAVRYTQAVTGKNALHLFLTESKIIDVQELSATDFNMSYEFNHIFRKSLTPVSTGKVILPDLGTDTKEAGRVYIYRTALKIDPTNAKQKFWVPANMKVIAFVTDMSAADKHIIQVQETNLK